MLFKGLSDHANLSNASTFAVDVTLPACLLERLSMAHQLEAHHRQPAQWIFDLFGQYLVCLAADFLLLTGCRFDNHQSWLSAGTTWRLM